MSSSSDLTSSDHMNDYNVPSIHTDRPKAPARRLPKNNATIKHKRSGTIEFMASFLMTLNRNTSKDPQQDSESSLPKTLGRKQSNDVKPVCPNRRGTMDFLWNSLRLNVSSREMVIEDTSTNDASGETAMSSVDSLEELTAEQRY